jgi:hypothetical protein
MECSGPAAALAGCGESDDSSLLQLTADRGLLNAEKGVQTMIVVVCVKRMMRPLASRKVRVALATVLAAYAAEYGLGVNEEMVFTVLGVGVALILGIAHEDAGKSGSAELKVLSAEGEQMTSNG